MANESESDSQAAEADFSVEKYVFGEAPLGFSSRHRVFKGFAASEEFNESLQTLMQWKLEREELPI